MVNRQAVSRQNGTIAIWRGTARALRRAGFLALIAHCLWLTAIGQYAQPPKAGGVPGSVQPQTLKDIRIEQRLNEQVPLDAEFRDETGNTVKLGDYFGTKPVVISLVYYNCPMLCNQVLVGLVGGLRAVPFTIGKEFDVVTVSFDPRETAADAEKKKESLLRSYDRADATRGWHFLTGDKTSIDRLAQAVGFHYVFDEKTNQFAHASGVMLATPQGKLSRYFYGIEYQPRDLRLGLVEASAGKIGSPVDQLVLYCYHYDPATGKYGPAIMSILRVTSMITLLGVVALILILRRHHPNQERAEAGGVA